MTAARVLAAVVLAQRDVRVARRWPRSRPARANPFACLGEGESLIRGNSTAEIEAEVRQARGQPARRPRTGPLEVARHHCVTAELMRRVGDPARRRLLREGHRRHAGRAGHRAVVRLLPAQRARAARAADRAGGAALLPGAGQAASASGPGGRPRTSTTSPSPGCAAGLMNLYQEDGLPLLRAKAFPYARNGAGGLGASLTTMVRASQDTNEFGVIDDARRFAAEAAFASSPQRLNRPLDDAELRGIIRTPLPLQRLQPAAPARALRGRLRRQLRVLPRPRQPDRRLHRAQQLHQRRGRQLRRRLEAGLRSVSGCSTCCWTSATGGCSARAWSSGTRR